MTLNGLKWSKNDPKWPKNDISEMSRFTRFARHKFSAARHLKLFCTPVCIPHMILKHQIISRFLQTERMLLEKVSPDTSLGSSQFTAWQSGLQVEAQKILACSIMLSRRRQQQRAAEGSCGCRTWRILSSVSTVFAKVLFSMIQLQSRSQGLMRCLGNGGRVPKRPGRA